MHIPFLQRGIGVCLCAAVLLSPAAMAREYPIGKPQHAHGMEVGAVYLQPVLMEPDGMMGDPAKSDVHLEADIHALANNANGFAEGDWLPYLVVSYTLQKKGSPTVLKGDLMAMVANDGPHYGDNIKLDGPGKYHLVFRIAPPSENKHAHFGRHTDKETGVAPWFPAFELSYDFVYAGIGKKGGY